MEYFLGEIRNPNNTTVYRLVKATDRVKAHEKLKYVYGHCLSIKILDTL